VPKGAHQHQEIEQGQGLTEQNGSKGNNVGGKEQSVEEEKRRGENMGEGVSRGRQTYSSFGAVLGERK